jgi:hypothetical protein
MVVMLKVVYRFNTIFIKIPILLFSIIETEKYILKFTQHHKGPQIAKMILSKKNKVRGFIYLDFKTHDKPRVTKTVCYWHTDSHIEQWNKQRAQK